MSDYIANYMGPTFAERLPDFEVWLGTMSNPNSASIVTTVMGNGTAAGYVLGIGLQWGMGDGNQPQTYASQYQIPIMQTEHQCGNFPNGSNSDRAPNDHAYAIESWGYFKKWIGKNVNSYMAWNMVLDTQGHNLDTTRLWAQNALLVVDRQAGTLKVTPTYYLFRHMSQYVEPGSVRVATQGGDALAWKNPDGSIVTVMHNSGGQAQNTTLSVAGKMLQFEIPARGWATVNWQGDSAE
jgi:glucosylceramidase